jgi:tetratricopeptide (TPR) repeat protein
LPGPVDLTYDPGIRKDNNRLDLQAPGPSADVRMRRFPVTPQVAASVDTLTRIIEMQPGTESAARAHLELGLLQLQRGELEKATQSFRQVPPHWPRWHGRAGLHIAMIYEIQLRDLGAAEREYRKVIRRHPDTHAAAECHSRLAEIYTSVGDLLSAENMRECALRAYGKVVDTSDDDAEREEALVRFVAVSRVLERWEPAVQALERQRNAAIARKDTARRCEIDRQLAEINEIREQHDVAAARYKECLAQIRRSGTAAEVAELTECLARCQRACGDAPAMKKTYQALLEYAGKDGARMTELLKDARTVPVLVRAHVATDRMAELKKLRSRLSRLTSADAKQAFAAFEAEMAIVAPAS